MALVCNEKHAWRGCKPRPPPTKNQFCVPEWSHLCRPLREGSIERTEFKLQVICN